MVSTALGWPDLTQEQQSHRCHQMTIRGGQAVTTSLRTLTSASATTGVGRTQDDAEWAEKRLEKASLMKTGQETD